MARVEEVACRDELSLEEFMEIAGRVLRAGGVKGVVVVENGRAVKNAELCAALKRLGARLIPVSSREEKVFVPLEALGFFDEISPTKYRVFMDSEELLYKNWPTPLVRLKGSSLGGKVAWAKLEGFNPWSMSVKDRVGWYMYVRAVERVGKPSLGLIVESTSTNTGLALAALANMHNSRLRAYIPSTVSATGEALLKIFGAEVVRSPKPLTVDLVEDVEAVARAEGAVHLNQFHNDANFEVHLRFTAKELELQLREARVIPSAIIGGLGTSGHLSALAFYFKNRFTGVKVYGVVPAQGTSIQGIRRVESGMKWLRYVALDGIIEVTLEEAVRGVLEVVRRDGLLVGLSSGAVYAAYRKMAEGGDLDDGHYILIFPDHGFKYVDILIRALGLSD